MTTDGRDGPDGHDGHATLSSVAVRLVRLLLLASVLPVLPLTAQAPIADNSFLIEEAYNQEPGVVQHINAYLRDGDGVWVYSFTQEWPLFSQRHQGSYTVPLLRGAGSEARLGDVFLNYRYQLMANARVAVAPRASLILPTGRAAQGAGTAAPGLQLNLPVSWTVGDHLVTHWNAGVIVLPRASSPDGARATVKAYNLGASLVWLATSRVNLLVETTWLRAEEVVAEGVVAAGEELVVVPGVRWAHDLAGGLQVVPGVAYVAGIGASRGLTGAFLYLSFEHPF